MFVPLNTFPYEWPIVVLNLAGRTILTFVVRSKEQLQWHEVGGCIVLLKFSLFYPLIVSYPLGVSLCTPLNCYLDLPVDKMLIRASK